MLSRPFGSRRPAALSYIRTEQIASSYSYTCLPRTFINLITSFISRPPYIYEAVTYHFSMSM